MATRKNLKQTLKTREKIQTSQLINRLQNHALSEEINELKPSQLKAIEILLKKSLPDLQSTEITGDSDAPVSLNVITGIKPKSND
jgi:hypothetical protein